jgi:hypothetical protein
MKVENFPWIGFLSFLIIISCSQFVTAQIKAGNTRGDSTLMIQPGMDTTGLSKTVKEVFVDSASMKRPKIATYYAAVLPGLGQIYNKNYWKLPILYGGAMTMGYFINWNNHKYHQYLQALTDKQNGVTTNELAVLGTSDLLKKGVDYYRRNRDYLMILLSGLYLIQIVDAQVQAQLMNFDINEDLSMKIKPILEDNGMFSRNFGIGIVLTFN